MGDAKRRRAEIGALKDKGPISRPRRKRQLIQVTTETVFHFKNDASHREAGISFRDSHQLTRAIQTNKVKHNLVQPVIVKVMTHQMVDKTAEPKQLRQITLVNGRELTTEEFLIHALAMSDITQGRGFRQPSAKEKNFRSTSLMEQLSIKMGVSQRRTGPEISDRGQKKRAAQIECNARIILDRLIEKYPNRALRAKKEERMVDWFVGMVTEALDGTPDLETLTAITNEHIQAFEPDTIDRQEAA